MNRFLLCVVPCFVGVGIQVMPATEVYRPRPGFLPRFEMIGGTADVVCAAAGGKYYVAGAFTGLGDATHSCIARFNLDGTVDASFQPDEILDGGVTQIAVQPDGRIVIGGRFLSVGGEARSGIARLNAGGSLDRTFQPGPGFPTTYNGPDVLALALQPDGDIVVAGGFDSYNGTPSNRLVRINPDGSRDATLAIGTGLELGLSGHVRLAALQDGKLLVGGALDKFDGVACAQLIRLNANGTLDPGFVFGATLASAVGGFAVQPDGRIVVGGSLADAGNSQTYGITRVTADGSLDASFSVDRRLRGSSFAFLPDGKILVGGADKTGVINYPPLVRLQPDGAADFTFLPASNAGEDVFAVALLADENALCIWYDPSAANGTSNFVRRITSSGAVHGTFAPISRTAGTVAAAQPISGGGWYVAGVFSHVNGIPFPGIARLAAGGAVDPAFTPPAALAGFASAIALQPDGKLLAAVGESSFGDRLVRLETTGALDAGFQTGSGFGSSGFNVSLDAVTLQADGKIIVGGAFTTYNGAAASWILRLNANGTLDSGFDPRPDGLVYSIVVQPDAKILLGGRFTTVQPGGAAVVNRTSVARFNADGTLDPTFDPGASFNIRVESIALQADGRMFVSGPPMTYDPSEPQYVRRLLAHGSADTGFSVRTFPGAQHSAVAPHPDGGCWVGLNLTSFTQVLSRLSASGALLTDLEWHNATTTQLPNFLTGSMGVDEIVPTSGGSVALGGSWISLGRRSGGGFVVLDPVPGALVVEQPVGQSSQTGGTGVTLSVEAVGNGAITYQWQFQFVGDGPMGNSRPPELGDFATGSFVDIAGATDASFSIPNPQRFHNGLYRVVVTANGLSTTSAEVVLSVAPTTTATAARLLNLSTRALAQTGDNVLIPGFVIAGAQSKQLLIRAVGPTLGLPPFNLPGVLPNPRIVVKRRDDITREFVDIAQNDDWGTNTNFAAIKQTAAAVFAFGIPDNSADAALLLDLLPGEYSVIAHDVGGASGIAIVELYDADADGVGSRLINISNRGFVGVGDQVMIPGFVVSAGPKTFLIRVVGPTLGAFGVSGTMTDPKLTVFRSNSPAPGDTQILDQDNWSENPDSAFTSQIASQVFAFPLADGSADAAFVVTLAPGIYSVIGASADGGGTGVVLVEVYVVE